MLGLGEERHASLLSAFPIVKPVTKTSPFSNTLLMASGGKSKLNTASGKPSHRVVNVAEVGCVNICVRVCLLNLFLYNSSCPGHGF